MFGDVGKDLFTSNLLQSDEGSSASGPGDKAAFFPPSDTDDSSSETENTFLLLFFIVAAGLGLYGLLRRRMLNVGKMNVRRSTSSGQLAGTSSSVLKSPSCASKSSGESSTAPMVVQMKKTRSSSGAAGRGAGSTSSTGASVIGRREG